MHKRVPLTWSLHRVPTTIRRLWRARLRLSAWLRLEERRQLVNLACVHLVDLEFLGGLLNRLSLSLQGACVALVRT